MQSPLSHFSGITLTRRSVASLVIFAAFTFCLPFSVLGQPTITKQPVSQSAVLGSRVTFTVDAVSAQPLSYQWRKNGVNIPGANGPSITISFVQSTDGGNYTVAVSDSVAAVESAVASLTISNLQDLPFADNFANRQPLPGLLNLGGSGRGSNRGATREPGEPLHDGKRGTNSVWISWRTPLLLGGVATINTAGSGFDTLLAVYKGDSFGNFTLVASDDDEGGYLNSFVTFNANPNTEYIIAIDGRAGQQGDIVLNWNYDIIQNVLDLLPVLTLQPLSRIVPSLARLDLQVDFNSQALATMQWYLNGVPVPGATEKTLTLQNVQPKDVGQYRCLVKTLTRQIFTKPADIQINQVDGLTLNVAALNKFPDAMETIQFQTVPASRLQKATASMTKIRKLTGGTATGYTGTQIFSTFNSTKEPGEPNHCGVAGGSSEWYSYVAPTNGVMTIDTIGSDFDTVLAIYTGPGTDFASLVPVTCDNDSGPDGRTSVVTFNASTNDVYYVVVDGVGGAQGKVHLNYQLTVPPYVIQQPASQSVVVAGDTSLSAVIGGVPAPACQWQFGGADIVGATNVTLVLTNVQPSQAGKYRILVSNSAGTVTSADAILTVIEPPVITTQPQNQTVVAGTNISLSVEVNGTAPLNFRWRRNGSEISGATNQILVLTNVLPELAGDYSVVVSNAAGSATSSNATLTVLEPPTIIQQPQSQTVYAGASVLLSVVASGEQPLSFQWRFNSVDISGAIDSVLVLTNVQSAQAGNYAVAVGNAAGVVISTDAMLTVQSVEPLRIISSERMTNGAMRLVLIGEPLQNVVVSASTNLLDWSAIFTNNGQTGCVEVIDTGATNCATRFYRATR